MDVICAMLLLVLVFIGLIVEHRMSGIGRRLRDMHERLDHRLHGIDEHMECIEKQLDFIGREFEKVNVGVSVAKVVTDEPLAPPIQAETVRRNPNGLR